MRAEFWAALTAVSWGVGSLLEKKGVKMGGLSPVMGTTVRTLVSLLILSVISYPYWGQVRTAGATSLSLVAIGGGVLSGAVGIVCLYAGLKSGNLAVVMAIAFSMSTVVGLLLGWVFLHERLNLIQTIGVLLCVGGGVLVTLFRDA